MAKGSSNPVDAFRKAQRAKELKKNKELRGKVRETQTIKKDTRDIESEIRSLKDAPKLDAASKSRLSDLEAELAKIIKIKEKYVSEHPEARDRIFRPHSDRPKREQGAGEGDDEDGENGGRYDELGRLRDPTKSVYFDPVYNPWGAPPPGMPYKERTPELEIEEDESEEDDESDEDIIMPEGPPPPSDDGSDDSDDIPLPPGSPPPKSLPPPPLPSGPSRIPLQPNGVTLRPPFPAQHIPYNPQNVPMGMGMPFRPSAPMQNTYRPPIRAQIHHDQPPTIQDPLSNTPTQTYQGHRMAQHDLPIRPPPPPTTSTTAPSGSTSTSMGLGNGNGEISAAPVLRDLRKEAVAFVPRGVKRKKAGPAGVVPGRINAAPGAGEIDADGDERKKGAEVGGGLLGKLKGVLATSGASVKAGSGGGGTSGNVQGSGDDDYQDFLKGLGELA